MYQIFGSNRFGPARQAGAVAHQMGDRDIGFAVGGKFRPVMRDRLGKIEITAIGNEQGGERGHRLGRRIDVDDRVTFPCPGLVAIGVACPQINDGLTLNRGTERGTDIRTARHIGVEQVGDGGEARLRGALCLEQASIEVPTAAWTSPPSTVSVSPMT